MTGYSSHEGDPRVSLDTCARTVRRPTRLTLTSDLETYTEQTAACPHIQTTTRTTAGHHMLPHANHHIRTYVCLKACEKGNNNSSKVQ